MKEATDIHNNQLIISSLAYQLYNKPLIQLFFVSYSCSTMLFNSSNLTTYFTELLYLTKIYHHEGLIRETKTAFIQSFGTLLNNNIPYYDFVGENHLMFIFN